MISPETIAQLRRKPFLYAIADIEGRAVLDEMCVAEHPSELELSDEDLGRGQKIVPVYTGPQIDGLLSTIEALQKERDEVEAHLRLSQDLVDRVTQAVANSRAEAEMMRAAISVGEYDNVLTDEEIGKWQDDVRGELMDGLKTIGLSGEIDGGGCDSGDWRDFTLAEIRDFVRIVSDWHYDNSKDGRYAHLHDRINALESERNVVRQDNELHTKRCYEAEAELSSLRARIKALEGES